MTRTLFVAVLVIGALTCVNLLLTYGVIRRLREHAGRLADGAGGAGLPPAEPRPGTEIPDFTAATVDGRAVTNEQFALGTAFIGFFSASCPPCRDQLPQFARFVTSVDAGRVLVVIADDADGVAAAELVAQARPVARVVVAPPRGPIETAFGVDRSPTMLVLHDGVVTANSSSVAQLPVATPS